MNTGVSCPLEDKTLAPYLVSRLRFQPNIERGTSLFLSARPSFMGSETISLGKFDGNADV